MRLETTTDNHLVAHFHLHDDVYPELKDDRAPNTFDSIPNRGEQRHYLVCNDDGSVDGIVSFVTDEGVTFIHPAFIRSRQAFKAIRGALAECGKSTVFASIPVNMRKVRLFAGQCGFRTQTYVSGAHHKDGVAHNSALMVWRRGNL